MIKQCTHPWTGITIDPNGWISLCCNTTDEKMLKHKISDVKSLKDFFVGEEFEYVKERYKGTLIYEMYYHDYKSGPYKKFNL